MSTTSIIKEQADKVDDKCKTEFENFIVLYMVLSQGEGLVRVSNLIHSSLDELRVILKVINQNR